MIFAGDRESPLVTEVTPTETFKKNRLGGSWYVPATMDTETSRGANDLDKIDQRGQKHSKKAMKEEVTSWEGNIM